MNPPFDIVLLGAPGAGKSTQSRMLKMRFDFEVLSTGQLLRAEVGQGSALGRLAAGYLEQGSLLPDDIVVALVTERITKLHTGTGVLLDGFPRTIPQAEALDQLLHQRGRALAAVVSLSLSEEEAVRRLGGRRMCTGIGEPYPVHIDDHDSIETCLRLGGRLMIRPDDEPEVIGNRLQVYEAETAPLLAYYRTRELLVALSAAHDAGAVQADILRALTDAQRRIEAG